MKLPFSIPQSLSLAAATFSISAITLPTFNQGQVSFSYESSTQQVFTVQAADSPSGTWTNLLSQRGTGSTLQFSIAADRQQRFFRIQATLFQTLDFGPIAPTLTSGDVSLPDAAAGAVYSEFISPADKGIPLYTLQVIGTPPDGVSLLITSNGTANASLKVASTGASLVVGQRRQFTISGTDSTGANATRGYDLRVIPPPPQIETTLITMKAGETVNASLTAKNGAGNLTFEIIADPKPMGVSMSSAGRFTGVPTADDAEYLETGRFITQVRITDSLTDRVTGLPSIRSTTNTIVQLVRLSFQQNLFDERPQGPRFSLVCTVCHGSGFTPDIGGLGPAIINAPSQELGSCGSRTYILPGAPEASLIYKKISSPDCGGRMPSGGPYYGDLVLERVKRWISELTPADND